MHKHIKYHDNNSIHLSFSACGSIDIDGRLGGVAHRIQGVRDIADALRLFAHLHLGMGQRRQFHQRTCGLNQQIDEEAIDTCI